MLFIQILNSKNKKEEDSSSRTRKLIDHLFSEIRRKDEISTKIRFKKWYVQKGYSNKKKL